MWVLKKYKMFLLGHQGFMIITDHRPLVKILGEKEQRNKDSPRLFSLMEKTLIYCVKIAHVKGDENTAANTLSRYPLKVCRHQMDEEDIKNEFVTKMAIKAVIAGIACKNYVLAMGLDEVKQVALADTVYIKLLNKIKTKSFGKTAAIEDPEIQPFFNIMYITYPDF